MLSRCCSRWASRISPASARTGCPGGERQRLALAVGLATAPGVLLADEPTSQLDDRNRDALVELLCSLAGDVTVIVVTHDDRLGDRFDRRIVLRDGRATG